MRRSKVMKKFISLILVFSLSISTVLVSNQGKINAENMLPTLPITETNSYPDTRVQWEATKEDLVYEHYELERFVKLGDDILQDLGISRDDFTQEPNPEINQDTLETNLVKYFNEFDYIQTLGNILNLEYTKDVTNTDLQKEMEYFSGLRNDVFEETRVVLQGIQQNSVLAPLLKNIIGLYNYQYIETIDKLNPEQKEIKEKIIKLQQEYNQTPRGNVDELIDIYIKLVSLNNEFGRESGYDNYYENIKINNSGRDFSDLDLQNYYQAVKDYIAPVYVYLSMNVNYGALSTFRIPINESIQSFVGKFIGNISSELLESYEYLLESSLLSLGTSEKNEDVSYTIRLPYYNSAAIFIKDNGDFNNINTFIHEFGHFNTIIRDTDAIYFDEYNTDIAEIHSQYLELLFLPYSKLMYGNLANQTVTAKLLDMVWSVLTGACFNEFEHFAHTQENLNSEMLRNKFSELCAEYKLNLSDDYWTNVWHFYNSPFYYLSYSISAMASLSQVDNINNDYRKAVHNYLTLTSYDESALPIMELLEQSNLPNIFDVEVIKDIGKSVSEFAARPNLYTIEDFDMSKSPDNLEDGSNGKLPRSGKLLPEYGDESDKSSGVNGNNNSSKDDDRRYQNGHHGENGNLTKPAELRILEDSASQIWDGLVFVVRYIFSGEWIK